MTRGDRLFRPVLLVLAAEFVALGIAMLPDPRQGSARTTALLGVILLTCIASALLLLLNRPFSRRVVTGFSIASAGFGVWSGLVIAVSLASGWWGGDGQPGYHLTLSFAVSALPLALAAWLLGRARADRPSV
jgi:hypothetical protein